MNRSHKRAEAGLAGARMEAIAGALGSSLHEAFDRWHEWALHQRDFITGGRPGITQDEDKAVAQRSTALGIMSRRSGAPGERIMSQKGRMRRYRQSAWWWKT
jgi:hypothetical protein